MTQAKPLCGMKPGAHIRHLRWLEANYGFGRAIYVASRWLAPINPPASDTPTDANSTGSGHRIAPGVTGEGAA